MANWSDNAYLALALIGAALAATAVPFALAALLPCGSRRRVVLILGIASLRVVGALGALVLVASLVANRSRNYRDGTPLFVRHLVGLILVLATLYLAGLRCLR